ncbi:helix-turn-helix transcriptional regulator [Corynebacterium cystitidis]|uniref:Hemoglobin n=1 Tax=Corynebacterium cystitidis DSM 20524 TaxID=1121357 RepID=A0A1H9SQ55_9CORY|nr:helix-turn-helix transcriptional regulator [Corynebacterium cystitidis]WJY83130.1 transcriptional regulator NarL [Corynebacterium cystitidis DSM 20524]SER86988.1 hemoglobin [Corynebacterium cystitidis DSM 20524]SNV66594.1 transcriptional regulator [Corynebacterium cystitidis]
MAGNNSQPGKSVLSKVSDIHRDEVLRGRVIASILEILDTHPQRLVIIPIVPGVGARRFLNRLATHLPQDRVRVVSALPWESAHHGALQRQIQHDTGAAVLIHDLDRADEQSLRWVVESTKRGGLRVVATVSSQRVHEFADDIIALAPFTLPETDQFVRTLVGTKLPALLVEDVHRATGGRPDYIAELLQATPRDQWSDANATLKFPQAWYHECEHATAGLGDDTRRALYSRPLEQEKLGEAVAAGIIDIALTESGATPEFRDPRFAALTQAATGSPPRATSPVEREKLLLAKAEKHAEALDLASAELFLQDCSGTVNVNLRDSLTGYVALYGGHRYQSEIFLGPVKDHAAQSLSGCLHELAVWNPSGLLQRARHTQSLTAPGSVEYEEAQVYEIFATVLLHRTYPPQLPDFAHPISHERLKMFMGWVALADDDPITAREQLRPVPGGSLSVALWRDALLARALFVLGQWNDAKAVVERGLSSCELHGVALLEPWLLWTGSLIAAMEGNLGLARSYLNRATPGADAFTIQRVPAAMGQMIVSAHVLDLATSLRAAEDLERAVEGVDTQQPGFWPWEDVYAQTLLRAGRIADADRVITEAEQRNNSANLASLRAKNSVPRASILLQRGQTARALSLLDDATVAIEHSAMPAYAARILFEYGLLLRRIGRRSHADDILGRASDLFAEMGAHVMVTRCNQERRVGGVGGHVHNHLGLTTQEEQIAHLAADGITNREIALQLTLSPKTVEYHLTSIYKKLEITGRAQLPEALKS